MWWEVQIFRLSLEEVVLTVWLSLGDIRCVAAFSGYAGDPCPLGLGASVTKCLGTRAGPPV